jgi:hypothetical protein
MYMSQDIKLTLGPTLAFNDLPSSIKASFTLQNARAWGLQEIIAKFNAGSIRVSTTIKDDMQRNLGDPQNATDKLPDKTKETILGTASAGSTPVVQSGAVNQPTTTSVVSNTVNSAGISTVSAGPQATDSIIPTPGNSGQSLPNTNNLTAGISSNIASEQAAAANVQNQVTSGVTGVQNQVNSAANSVKVNDGVTNVMNPVANQVNGEIPSVPPFDPSMLSGIRF